MINGVIFVFFALLVLSVVCIVLSIVFLRKGRHALSIATAFVGAKAGMEVISMVVMFGFITDILFVVYAIIIVFLNYKKYTAKADETSENERGE